MDARQANLHYALHCAKLGLYVFPCGADKKPLVKWRAASTVDPEQIKQQWAEHPDAIPGIDLAKSDHVVVDGDRHGGPDGVAAVKQLFAEHNTSLENVPSVITPGSGVHNWFTQPNGKPLGNSDKPIRELGINIRGAGGYVIAPGAQLPDGRRYTRDKDTPNLFVALRENTVPPLPDWFVELLRPPKARHEQDTPRLAQKLNGGIRHHRYAEAALDRLCGDLANVPKKAGRNIELNNAALQMGHMIASGWIDRAVVEQGLIKASTVNGLVADGRQAVLDTIASGINAGLKEPQPELPDRPHHNERTKKFEHQQADSTSPRKEQTEPPALDPKDPMRSARELVAAQFIDEKGKRLLHHHRGGFYRYAGNCYRPGAPETLHALIWKFLDGAVVDEKGNPPFKPTQDRVSNVAAALAAVCHLEDKIDPPAWLNGHSLHAGELLPVANGLLHLPSGQLIASTPLYFGLAASDVAFDPAAPLPEKWLHFLQELWGDDAEAIATLQEWFGYVLSPDTSQQKILFVAGPKRCGKGTIARVLTALLGRDNITAPTLGALQTNFGLAPLIGKPLAILSDARLGGRSDQAVIVERLLSISGEDSLTVDRKYQSAWTGRFPTRLMLLANELPSLADSSGALAGRFIMLVLEQSFYGREDPGLTGRLLTELPGILNWARDGYLRLQERGHFKQPTSGREAAEQMELLAAPVKAFLRDKCTVGAGLEASCELLYQSWCLWCDANGKRKPGTQQSFGRDLKAAFSQTKVIQHQGTRYYNGIALKARGTATDTQ